MGNSEIPRAKGIPSWQLQENSNELTAEKDQAAGSVNQPLTDARAALIEKASKFLNDDDIRSASADRKTFFLESRGLSSDEIQKLLQQQHATQADVEDDTVRKPQGSSQPRTSSTDSQQPDETESSTARTDAAPIITYPEFLLHSQKPPPLITARRLLTTLYLASGAAATIYGTSKYIVEPMVENLSLARHSLFESASAKIITLNEKLEGVVSKVPDGGKEGESLEGKDTESASSDPARFFSRTAATQTSPHFSRSPSATSMTSSLTPPVVTHATNLSKLHGLLSDLRPLDPLATNPTKKNLQELQEYLHGLPLWESQSLNGKGGNDANADGIAKVKADIRGVKGVLLSARNFPSSSVTR